MSDKSRSRWARRMPSWYTALRRAGVEYPYFAAAEAAMMADQLDLIGRAPPRVRKLTCLRKITCASSRD